MAQFPAWAQELFRPHRYKVAYGGRGSTKSWSFARALLTLAYQGKYRILCARELQTSITESVHQLLADQITLMGLDRWFEVQKIGIRALTTNSEFFFYGIRNNVTKIKSTEGVDIVWVEEAEKISEESWKILIPTVRRPGSEIWISFNPDEENDPTYQRFVVNTPPDAWVEKVNWTENPWFPEELRREREYLYRVDPDAAEWVWEGNPRTNRSSQIFRDKYSVEAFEVPTDRPDLLGWDGPYLGADWGFANDPTVLMKLWIKDRIQGRSQGTLFIEYEASGIGVEITDTPALFDKVPGSRKGLIRADNARPETISHVANAGFRIVGCEKWKGCEEDRVAYMRSFEKIVIHPRCTRQIQEAKLYSFKVDRLTKDVTTDIVDKHNHCWDANGYALEPLIMSTTSAGVWSRL
jgi:phage terminase large subunit